MESWNKRVRALRMHTPSVLRATSAGGSPLLFAVPVVVTVIGAAVGSQSAMVTAQNYALFLICVAVIAAICRWTAHLPALAGVLLGASVLTLLLTGAPWGQILCVAVAGVGIVMLAARSSRWRELGGAARREADLAGARIRRLAAKLLLLHQSDGSRALLLLDAGGKVDGWDAAAERLTGWTRADMLGESIACVYHAEDRAAGMPEDDLARASRAGETVRRTVVAPASNADHAAIEMTLVVRRDLTGEVEGFGCVLRDRSRELALEKRLEATERRFRAVLNAVSDALVLVDDQMLILAFNGGAETMFGVAERDVVGKPVSILIPPPDRERHDGYFARYLDTGDKHLIGQSRRLSALARDGSVFPISLSLEEAIEGDRRTFIGLMRDLRPFEAEQHRMQLLQNELFHASRVSAVGMMGTTLAHELNQPLTGLVNYVEAAKDLLAASRDEAAVAACETLERAACEAMRSAEIVSRMRDFIGNGPGDRSLERFSRIITEAVSIALLGSKADGLHVSYAFEADDALLLVDRIQIQQVIVNLLRNAAEVMAPAGGGRLTLSTHYDRSFVCLSVQDEGPGIAAGVAAQLFEPFVSSKPHGLGLGLSICRAIVEAHGGRIWARTRPPNGADFRIRLPLARLDGLDGPHDA